MSLELDRAINGLLCIGFAGTSLDDDLRRRLDRGLGGVIAFGHNVQSRARVAELMHDVRGHAGRALVCAVDQEGGRVARLREGFNAPGPMADIGKAGDVGLANAAGRAIGSDLAAVGFNLALAPVLDLATNPDSKVIGDRSLGTNPSLVGELGTAVIHGIQAFGVMACAKHFPGHGDTPEDSHLTLPRVDTPADTIRSRELAPFAAAIRAGVDCVMPGHLVVEAFDPDRPATTSPTVVTDLLRGEMGFEGLVVSDDLEMAAVAETIGVERAAVGALRAGVDLLLACKDPRRAEAVVQAIREAVEAGELEATSVVEKADRIRLAAASADREITRVLSPSVDARARSPA